MLKKMRSIALSAFLLAPAVIWAAHPLITDDAGTVGRAMTQLELNGQYDRDSETAAAGTAPPASRRPER